MDGTMKVMVFYEKEDLLKVYGIEKEQFNMLES